LENRDIHIFQKEKEGFFKLLWYSGVVVYMIYRDKFLLIKCLW